MTNTNYNYRTALYNDIEEYLNYNYTSDEFDEKLLDRESFEEELNENLWTEDSVTGNASGSYTFNRCKAEENLNGNLSLMVEAFKEFDCINQLTDWLEDENFEAIDVSIRCYLLSECITKVLDDIYKLFECV